MIAALRKIIQQRKEKLISCLNNKSDELSLERQHQLYGAINELDLIIELLNDGMEKEIKEQKSAEEVLLFNPIEEKDFFTKIKGYFR